MSTTALRNVGVIVRRVVAPMLAVARVHLFAEESVVPIVHRDVAGKMP